MRTSNSGADGTATVDGSGPDAVRGAIAPTTDPVGLGGTYRTADIGVLGASGVLPDVFGPGMQLVP